jgi:hydrogenase maturation protease
MRDLDFGRRVIDYLQDLDWPDGVVVEDLSCSAPLVLNRLQELRPAKVVLLGAVPRGFDPPATLRRYQLDLTPPPPAKVHRSLEESAMGMVDIDQTLSIARHWGGLPADTVIIEVEPAEAGFGVGFSDDLAACFDPILDLVREELGDLAVGAGRHRDLVAEDVSAVHVAGGEASAADRTAVASDGMTELVDYARDHALARVQVNRSPALLDRTWSDAHGMSLVGRVRPWGVFVESGGDWFDAIPLGDDRLGILVGNVAGRGVAVAANMSDLRAAARAYAVIDGDSPVRMLHHLDRLAETTGLGHQARVLYLIVRPASGDVRFCRAGGCPPLVIGPGAPRGRYVDGGGSGPLGRAGWADRPMATERLEPGTTLLLFTDGLVESGAVARAVGLERLRLAAVEGPDHMDDLCDHILTACIGDLRRDDDICLVGLRLHAASVPARVPRSHG